MTTDSNSIPDEIRRKARSYVGHHFRWLGPDEVTGLIATAIHDAVMAERERCIDVARKTLVDARMGEIDTDLRCIAHILENRMQEHAAPPKAGGE